MVHQRTKDYFFFYGILERRAEHLFHSQSDAGHMFETYRPSSSTYATSASLQNLHYSPYRQQRISPPKPQPTYSSHLCQSQSFPSELDNAVHTNDFERSSFHPTVSHKMTKMIPKDNYSLSNGRSTTQQRSASACNSIATKCKFAYKIKHHFLNLEIRSRSTFISFLDIK